MDIEMNDPNEGIETFFTFLLKNLKNYHRNE